jgi:argininosuccinate lyase
MFATDIALVKAAQGVPFRSAYLEAKKTLGEVDAVDATASLAQRVSPGACGDLQLERIRRRLEQEMSRAESSHQT